MSYIKADFTLYTLPIPKNKVIIPEQAKVITPQGISLALGALCYRESKTSGKNYYIIPDSLIQARIVWVKK